MFRPLLAACLSAVMLTSACVVPTVPGTSPTTSPSVGNQENWGVSLRGRGLQRPGEFVNFFSDGTFAWDGPNGQQSGVWTGGPNRLCLTVQSPGTSTNLCGTAYLTNGQLEFLSDNGGAPIYWNIV